jgi:hypothetical protein
MAVDGLGHFQLAAVVATIPKSVLARLKPPVKDGSLCPGRPGKTSLEWRFRSQTGLIEGPGHGASSLHDSR